MWFLMLVALFASPRMITPEHWRASVAGRVGLLSSTTVRAVVLYARRVSLSLSGLAFLGGHAAPPTA